MVREGPEAYVFLSKGDKYERYPVQVLHEDSRGAVLAFDAKLERYRVALNGAVQLNWMLKMQRAGGD